MNTKSIAFFGKSGIGNFVLYTPALRAIASIDESEQIDICCHDSWNDPRKDGILDIIGRLPFVQNVCFLNEQFKKSYKTWFWVNWLCQGSGRELFGAMRHYDPPEWDQLKVHESDYYFRIAKEIYGYRGWKPTQLIVPDSAPNIETKAKKVVLCNGGFGELSIFKRWPNFDELAKQIKGYYGDDSTIIKIGYREELNDVKTFDFDFVNKLKLTETARVIQQADLMITTDTGNMHIADALGTPCIVLWGGASLAKNKPYNAMNKIITLGLPCQPCQREGGYKQCDRVACIQDITVNEIMFHVKQYFREGRF